MTCRDTVPSAPADERPAGPWFDARACGASGSEAELQAAARAGSPRIETDGPGDFQAGQWVLVTGAHIHYPDGHIYAASLPWRPEHQAPLGDELEIRGFDDVHSDWQVFVLHIDPGTPPTFRWLAVDPAFQPNHRRWTWQGEGGRIGGDWQPLRDGVEIRFRRTSWEPGQVLAFHARSRLVTRIRSVAGRDLLLEHAPTRSAPAARVRHVDQAALQQAVERAAAARMPLFIPAGRYRLLTGLRLENLSLRIEGAGAEHTLLDISDGIGAVFTLRGGRDVAVRHLGMVGHTGFNQLPWYSFRTAGGSPFWPTANQQIECKGCAAANICATERVLFEDVAVRRMASEAFYSQGPDRFGAVTTDAPDRAAPTPYTKSITYHRCRVSDCASNAFNNNDFAENTTVQNCHVENCHNAWEGANRFTRFIGNTVKNAHCGSYVAGGGQAMLRLGTGQAIIAHNVFEGGVFGQGLMIAAGPQQVIVADNLFVNFSNQSAICVAAPLDLRRWPPRNIQITGNLIDLTHVEGQLDRPRAGIVIGAGHVVVADNQIYVRGPAPDHVTGIRIAEWAVNVHVHDNLIENCAHGLRTGYAAPDVAPATGAYQGERSVPHLEAEVEEALGPDRFRERGLPVDWPFAAPFAGWSVHWLSGAQAGAASRVAAYDQDQRALRLEQPLPVQAGDRFAAFPAAANWQLHHNTIAGCRDPVTLDGYGSAASRCSDNLISRGAAPDARRALTVCGQFEVAGNRLAGFDPDTAIVAGAPQNARHAKAPSV